MWLYRTAAVWNEHLWEKKKIIFGEEHSSTLTSMANLAATYWNQGRWKEAEELQVRVMETMKKVLREEHPDTLTSMKNLAFTLKYQSRDAQPISLMRRYCKLQMQVLGPGHPHTEALLDALHEWEGGKNERERSD